MTIRVTLEVTKQGLTNRLTETKFKQKGTGNMEEAGINEEYKY